MAKNKKIREVWFMVYSENIDEPRKYPTGKEAIAFAETIENSEVDMCILLGYAKLVTYEEKLIYPKVSQD